jgi:ankyrin repeat protein
MLDDPNLTGDALKQYLKDVRKHPERLDKRSNSGETPLIKAVIAGNEELFDGLLDAGANPNIGNHDHVTPLMLAVLNDQDYMFDRLLHEPNIELDTINHKGETALILAVRRDRIRMVQKLVDCGANTEIVDENGRGAYHYAVSRNNKLMMDILDLIPSSSSVERRYRIEFYFTDDKNVTRIVELIAPTTPFTAVDVSTLSNCIFHLQETETTVIKRRRE